MSMRRWLFVMSMGCVMAATAANEPDNCAKCKAGAVAEQSQCLAVGAPDPALRATCDARFAEASRSCQEGACRVEVESLAAAQCGDCAKQADAELRKCAPLPATVRAACEARVAGVKKACDDRFCPVPKVK
jgi:hypothetical protein